MAEKQAIKYDCLLRNTEYRFHQKNIQAQEQGRGLQDYITYSVSVTVITIAQSR